MKKKITGIKKMTIEDLAQITASGFHYIQTEFRAELVQELEEKFDDKFKQTNQKIEDMGASIIKEIRSYTVGLQFQVEDHEKRIVNLERSEL